MKNFINKFFGIKNLGFRIVQYNDPYHGFFDAEEQRSFLHIFKYWKRIGYESFLTKRDAARFIQDYENGKEKIFHYDFEDDYKTCSNCSKLKSQVDQYKKMNML